MNDGSREPGEAARGAGPWRARAFLASLSLAASACASPPALPPDSPARVAQGRRLFLASCAHCHGADATGDEGPDLHRLEVSDRTIANTILRGIRGEMPSFAKKHDAADRAALTAYLRSLD